MSRSSSVSFSGTPVQSPLQWLTGASSAIYAYLDGVADRKVARGVSLLIADGKYDWKNRLRPHLQTLDVRGRETCPLHAIYGGFDRGIVRLRSKAPDIERQPSRYGFNGFLLGHWMNRAWARAAA